MTRRHRRMHRILRALSRGAHLRHIGTGRVVIQRGRHVRGVRSRAVRQLEALLLVRGGRITEAGRLVLAFLAEERPC